MGFLRWRRRGSSASDVSMKDAEEAAAEGSVARQPSEEPAPPEAQDSATDPALLAAILESLKTARPDGSPAQLSAASRFLCRNISQADPEVAGELRQRRAAQLHTSPDGISYFEADEDSDRPLTLPSFQGYPAEARAQVLGQLCNDYLQDEAERAGAINAIPGCTPQFVLNTQGDGNCLSHACSLGVWGVHDRDATLRGAIRATMTHPLAGQDIRLRFELQLRQNGIPQEEWAAEWRRELTAFHSSQRMSDRYLSDVHCFTLANVLRRPLLLYGDEHAALAGLTGIYLPLLWPPSACCRDPVAVLFWGSHFSVLCTVEGEGPAQPQLLPLCTRDGPMQVRFLSAAESKLYGAGAGCAGPLPLALLKQYLDCERLPAAAAVWRGRGTEAHNNAGCADASCTITVGAAGEKSRSAAAAAAAAQGGPGWGEEGEAPALGVRLSAQPASAPQSLLQLLEAAFVSQTAALVASGRRRSSRATLGGSGRSSCASLGDGTAGR